MKKEGKIYIDELKKKSVGERPIYPAEVLENILKRNEYLTEALELQERANNFILSLGKTFGIEPVSPKKTQKKLHEKSLRNFSRKMNRESNPKIFIALAGPGGAGKDTVFENAEKELSNGGLSVVRINKFTTRDSSRPGAYHFRKDIDELHGELGDLFVTEDEVDRLRKYLRIDTKNILSLSHLKEIQTKIDEEGSDFTEWNIELHPDRTSLVE